MLSRDSARGAKQKGESEKRESVRRANRPKQNEFRVMWSSSPYRTVSYITAKAFRAVDERSFDE